MEPANAAARAVILVEGASDRAALEVLARRRGRDLAAEGVEVVAMDGATNIVRFLERYGPDGAGVQVAGLYDIGEERFFQRGVERAGLARDVDRDGLRQLGFFLCDADLEDELLRAVGVERVEEIVAEEGELRSFRTMQRQPAQRDRSLHEQLHRMIGARSGHKKRYAELLTEAVPLDRVPPALDAVIAFVG